MGCRYGFISLHICWEFSGSDEQRRGILEDMDK